MYVQLGALVLLAASAGWYFLHHDTKRVLVLSAVACFVLGTFNYLFILPGLVLMAVAVVLTRGKQTAQ